MKKSSYKYPETRLLNSNFSRFKYVAINTRNCFGFSLQNGGQRHPCYHFLKTLNLRQNLHSWVIQILFTGMYYFVKSIIFAGQPLFTNFILLRSEDRGGILSLDIFYFNDWTFYLTTIHRLQYFLWEIWSFENAPL